MEISHRVSYWLAWEYLTGLLIGQHGLLIDQHGNISQGFLLVSIGISHRASYGSAWEYLTGLLVGQHGNITQGFLLVSMGISHRFLIGQYGLLSYSSYSTEAWLGINYK